MTHAAHRLIPVPSQRWHRTTLSPFLTVPLPSQFLHFCFFLPSLFCIGSSRSNGRAWREGRAKREHEAAASDAVYLSPSQRATRGHEFLTSAAARGASLFKMMDVSRHKSVDVLRGYVRDAEAFRDHAGAGLL